MYVADLKLLENHSQPCLKLQLHVYRASQLLRVTAGWANHASDGRVDIHHLAGQPLLRLVRHLRPEVHVQLALRERRSPLSSLKDAEVPGV